MIDTKSKKLDWFEKCLNTVAEEYLDYKTITKIQKLVIWENPTYLVAETIKEVVKNELYGLKNEKPLSIKHSR